MTPAQPAIGTVITRDVWDRKCTLCGCVIDYNLMCKVECPGDRLTFTDRKGQYTIRCWRRVDTLVSEERPEA